MLCGLDGHALVGRVGLGCHYRSPSTFRLQRKLRWVDLNQRLTFLYRVTFADVYLLDPSAHLGCDIVDLHRHDLARGLDFGLDPGLPLHLGRLDRFAIALTDDLRQHYYCNKSDKYRADDNGLTVAPYRHLDSQSPAKFPLFRLRHLHLRALFRDSSQNPIFLNSNSQKSREHCLARRARYIEPTINSPTVPVNISKASTIQTVARSHFSSIGCPLRPEALVIDGPPAQGFLAVRPSYQRNRPGGIRAWLFAEIGL